MKGHYAMSVSGNRRLTFRLEDGDVFDVDSESVNERVDVSADMAIRLSKALGSTPETWLGIQAAQDLWHAHEPAKEIKIKGFAEPGPAYPDSESSLIPTLPSAAIISSRLRNAPNLMCRITPCSSRMNVQGSPGTW